MTALGTTLTLKLLSDRPVFAPAFGIYSHRIGEMWLAGGASNTGGGVLLQTFTPDRLEALSDQIDPQTDSGLDYYPLPAPGERFPVSDPAMEPRMTSRPDDDLHYLHGLLEGMARIEALRPCCRICPTGSPLPDQETGSVTADPARKMRRCRDTAAARRALDAARARHKSALRKPMSGAPMSDAARTVPPQAPVRRR